MCIVTSEMQTGHEDVPDEPQAIFKSKTDVATQTDFTDATPTCTLPTMTSVHVSTEDLEYAALMKHDHSYITTKWALEESSRGSIPGTHTAVPTVSWCADKSEHGGESKADDMSDDGTLDDEDNDYIPASPSSDSSNSVTGEEDQQTDDILCDDKYIIFAAQAHGAIQNMSRRWLW